MKTIKATTGETRLEKTCRLWLNARGRDYGNGWQGAYSDLEQGGCQSGMVSELIYYKDTISFYKKHAGEIGDLLKRAIEDGGACSPADIFGDKWDKADPLAFDPLNQNLLAWFAFEETCSRLASANGGQG